MDVARWQQIQAVFHQAAGLDPTQRPVFLDNACGEDHELLREVEAMLEHDGRTSSLLDGDLAEVAHNTLTTPRGFEGKKFGPYSIVKLLGEGGMGVVYLGERLDLGAKVAIKILRDAWLSPARRERFVSEQRTLAQLNHPSIARLYDAATLDDGIPYFVMEYV